MPISAIGIPHRINPRPKSDASRERPTSRAAANPPINPPIPTAELRKPIPASPRSRSSSAGDDDQHVERPGDERLGAVEQHDHTQPGVARHGREAREHASAATAPREGLRYLALDADPAHKQRREQERDRRDGEHGVGGRRHEEQPADRRPQEDPERLDRRQTRFDAVSSSGRASSGRSADWVGRKIDWSIPTTPASR